MTDFETHPAGTAARIEQLEAQNKELGNVLAAYMAEAFTAGRTVKELTEALTRANAANDIWRKNSRETFEAMVAMRDSINEFVPMPSLESDLLQGPENSVFCVTVADAVVSALTRANAATAAAFEVAARVITDRKSEMADVSRTLVGTEKVIFAEIVSLLDIVAAAILAASKKGGV